MAQAVTPPATIELFTAEEAAAWNAVQTGKPDFGSRELSKPGVPNCHALPNANTATATDPQIKILAPLLDKPLLAPLDIDVQFIPEGGGAIRADTFRVCYVGFVTVDITKRITDKVAVSASGLHVAGAQLPHGHHHLVMMIADEQGHQGRREATFDIQ
jgi:hypothetical protein